MVLFVSSFFSANSDLCSPSTHVICSYLVFYRMAWPCLTGCIIWYWFTIIVVAWLSFVWLCCMSTFLHILEVLTTLIWYNWYIQAVQQLQLNKMNASASAQQMNQSQLDVQIETATELFRNLVMNSDTEGRYLLLNAIANQLRYPNNHTHYFSFIILYLFSEANQVSDDYLLFGLLFLFVCKYTPFLMGTKSEIAGNSPGANN